MPKKEKNISINVLNKRKTWHIKSESKTSILLSYCELIPLSIILCFLGKSRAEPKLIKYILGTLTDHFLSGPPKDHSVLASHTTETHPTDQSSFDLQKSLNLNIASYFIYTLAPPHDNSCHNRGWANYTAN